MTNSPSNLEKSLPSWIEYLILTIIAIVLILIFSVLPADIQLGVMFVGLISIFVWFLSGYWLRDPMEDPNSSQSKTKTSLDLIYEVYLTNRVEINDTSTPQPRRLKATLEIVDALAQFIVPLGLNGEAIYPYDKIVDIQRDALSLLSAVQSKDFTASKLALELLNKSFSVYDLSKVFPKGQIFRGTATSIKSA